jgi:hypothetical protein
MSDDLYAYLGDLSGPEYAWLGHFRGGDCISEGHNTSLEEQISAGQIPTITPPKETAADQEPSSISDPPKAQDPGGSIPSTSGSNPQSSKIVGPGFRSTVGKEAGQSLRDSLGSLFGL